MRSYWSRYKKEIGLLLGGFLSVLCYSSNPLLLPQQANQVFAITVLMILWWVFEALPLAVVALLPIILFPTLQIYSLKEVTLHYGDSITFLFMGGFFIALAIEKWGLHQRIALGILSLTGTNGNRIIFGFIVATGLLSLWLSNTATTMMMFPIALSVIKMIKNHHTNEKEVANFSLVLLLSIAYASNFAIGTIIATPPNVAYVGYIKDRFHYSITFMDWMLLFLPLTVLLLLSLYWVLVKVLHPNHIQHSEEATLTLAKAQKALGVLTPPEKRVLVVFVLTVFLWISKDFWNRWQSILVLDDAIIALFGAFLLFLTPAGTSKKHQIERLLSWSDTKNMAWDVLLLFGGGIALANAIEKSQLVTSLGKGFEDFGQQHLFLLILGITTVSVFLSEVISNLALVLILSPVVTSLAVTFKLDPLLLGIPMTLGASCACMLPMGTPPNAIIFAKGHLKMQQMVSTGFVLNLVCILLISVFCWLFQPLVMGL